VTITVNHTILPVADNEAAARFFAEVMGLDYAGPHMKFAPVRVNPSFTIDYLTVENAQAHHLAFDVDPATFDGILARIMKLGVPFGSNPREPQNGRIDHPLCPRGLFFADPNGHLYEVMSPA
jgi:catechol 2,3-dioxygenase-like lactoylglutathione lyase family enzyme